MAGFVVLEEIAGGGVADAAIGTGDEDGVFAHGICRVNRGGEGVLVSAAGEDRRRVVAVAQRLDGGDGLEAAADAHALAEHCGPG